MTNGGSAVSGRHSYRTEGRDERKHFLVLRSEAIVHDSINEWVDRTTDVPQARREEENLSKNKNKVPISKSMGEIRLSRGLVLTFKIKALSPKPIRGLTGAVEL